MKLLAILALIFVAVCHARHIHPGSFDPDEIIFDRMDNVGTDIPNNMIRNVRPSRFVPVNSVLFFKTFDYEPCEDGFKRDVLGICREVWD